MTKQQRGIDRRRALIDAGARILESVGPGQFSARRVATEAGVPLAAITYYFDSLDELLGSATDLVVAGWLEHGHRVAQEARGGDFARIATTLTLALIPGPPKMSTADHRRTIQARYEQLLSAGRSPVVSTALAAVRPALYDLIAVILELAETPVILSPATVLAIIDGAAVGAISESAPDPVAFIVDILTQALAGAATGSQPSQSAKELPEIRS